MKFPIYPKLYLGTLTIAIMALFFYMQSLPSELSDIELQFIHQYTNSKKGHWTELQQVEHNELVSLCRDAYVRDENVDDEKSTIYLAEPVVQQIKVTFEGRYECDLLTDLLRCTVLTVNTVRVNFYLAEGDTEDSVFKLLPMRNSSKNGPAWLERKIAGIQILSNDVTRIKPSTPMDSVLQ